MLFRKGKAIYVETRSQGGYVGCLSGFMGGKDSGPNESIEVMSLGK